MARKSTIWPRKGRGYWSTIRGQQVFLGNDLKSAKREFERRQLERATTQPGRHTVPQLCKIYLAWSKGEVKPATQRNYRYALSAWAADYYDVKPRDLRAYHVTRWLAAHPEWNVTTKCLRARCVKIWSAWCDAEGYLDGDRLRKARLPTPLTREPVPVEDLERLDRAITCPSFGAFFRVLFDTGARPDEIATLEAGRIDWAAHTAVVVGKKGPRLIGITPRCIAILREEAKACPSGPILRTPRGSVWSEMNQKRHMDRWQIVSKASTHLTPYDCRHSLWRRWHAAGISDIVISRQMGHSLRGAPSLSLLNSTYGHAGASELSAAALAVEQAASAAAAATRPLRIG